jgi:hypothetical protein
MYSAARTGRGVVLISLVIGELRRVWRRGGGKDGEPAEFLTR